MGNIASKKIAAAKKTASGDAGPAEAPVEIARWFCVGEERYCKRDFKPGDLMRMVVMEGGSIQLSAKRWQAPGGELTNVGWQEEWSVFHEPTVKVCRPEYSLIHVLAPDGPLPEPQRFFLVSSRGKPRRFVAPLEVGATIADPEPVETGIVASLRRALEGVGEDIPLKTERWGFSIGDRHLYVLLEDPAQLSFVGRSVIEMETMGGVEWKDGVLVNGGLLLYYSFCRKSRNAGSPIRFSEYIPILIHAGLYWKGVNPEPSNLDGDQSQEIFSRSKNRRPDLERFMKYLKGRRQPNSALSGAEAFVRSDETSRKAIKRDPKEKDRIVEVCRKNFQYCWENRSQGLGSDGTRRGTDCDSDDD